MQTILSKTEKRVTLAALGLLLLTFFFDDALLRRGVGLRFNWLDGLMLFITDFGLLFLFVTVVISLLLEKKYRLLTLLAVSLMFSFEISYLIKLIFQTPRPYFNLELATIPLTQASGFSFPSLHSAVCFALIPFVGRMFEQNWEKIAVVVTALLITYSRAYLGVHYFSDIFAGGLIGYLFSKTILYLEFHYQAIDWFLGHVKSKLELRRQIAHLLLGVMIVFLIELKLMTAHLLFVILMVGAAISLIYKYKPIPVIHEILVWLERPQDLATFPGKGPFFLVLGSLLSMLLFPIDIAKAAIMVLAIGDSVSHIVGRYFGKTKIPFSKNKKMEGTVVAIAFSVLGALLFVDFPSAFIASLITMSVEAIYPEAVAKYLDDNLLVPLLAGGLMMLLI
jgi:dolichol kinase